MVLNTFTVGAAVTPTVIKTYASHYLNRKPRAQKPTAHISYDEGLHLIRQFLNYASNHTVEEIQAFTSQWVPSPRWVRCEDVEIPESELTQAANALIAQLGHKGIDRVGGKLWWQWRRDGSRLRAEWIEMRSDYNKRKKHGQPCRRVMLYVHGGAYFFGSVDEHRYQLQRHARKLQARVIAPRYRLAPQFPFPCGLLDCLATYLYLLTIQDPSTILLAGDSAGGGMLVSLLVILRDQGFPLPAGAILISPWVDLTHSFPSVSGVSEFDYIPPHGFMHRPSMSWPPPNEDDMEAIAKGAVDRVVQASMPRKSTQQERRDASQAATQGFSVHENGSHADPYTNENNPAGTKGAGDRPGNTIPGPGHKLSIMIDKKMVEIKDQIQMYTTNQLIANPLVSPVMQPSLGGLPPLLILTGGGEMLKDEQIYLAHKAANPSKYPPAEAYLRDHPEARDIIHKYPPTDVHLQVWDDLCHVAPTLSFTRPAKFMYRSVAQFGAWALARAQKTEIDILDDDAVSIISSGSSTPSESERSTSTAENGGNETVSELPNGAQERLPSSAEQVGKAGDPLPPFRGHMIRQKVNRHGIIFPLPPEDELPAMQMSPNEIGVIKPGPVRKWMAAKKEWDGKFAKQKRTVQRQRIKEIANGFQTFGDDDVPPPSALAGRRGLPMPEEKKKKSMGLSLWSLWGSSHDQKTLEREEKADQQPETESAKTNSDAKAPRRPALVKGDSRSRSRHRTVSYQGQTDSSAFHEDTTNIESQRRGESSTASPVMLDPSINPNFLSPSFVPIQRNDENTSLADEAATGVPQLILPGTNVTLDSPTATRPKADGIAFPFKLGKSLGEAHANASMITLKSEATATSTPVAEAGEDEKGLGSSTAPANAAVEEIKAQNGELSNSAAIPERPQPERFETAREEL